MTIIERVPYKAWFGVTILALTVLAVIVFNLFSGLQGNSTGDLAQGKAITKTQKENTSLRRDVTGLKATATKANQRLKAHGLPPVKVPPATAPLPGAQGIPGLLGLPGPRGETGARGAVGATGAVGPIGPKGAIGANGTNGADGAAGSPGADGKDGANGVDGKDGAPGQPGVDGKDGRGVTSVDCSGPPTQTFVFQFSDGTTQTVACSAEPAP